MDNLARHDNLNFAQDTFTSFKGYEFNINDDFWILDINTTINVKDLRNLRADVLHEVLLTLAFFAQYSSSFHTAAE